jgi:hypothetical protein
LIAWSPPKNPLKGCPFKVEQLKLPAVGVGVAVAVGVAVGVGVGVDPALQQLFWYEPGRVLQVGEP